jgi:hypothetical protein
MVMKVMKLMAAPMRGIPIGWEVAEIVIQERDSQKNVGGSEGVSAWRRCLVRLGSAKYNLHEPAFWIILWSLFMGLS